jgi:hypothetical protein
VILWEVEQIGSTTSRLLHTSLQCAHEESWRGHQRHQRGANGGRKFHLACLPGMAPPSRDARQFMRSIGEVRCPQLQYPRTLRALDLRRSPKSRRDLSRSEVRVLPLRQQALGDRKRVSLGERDPSLDAAAGRDRLAIAGALQVIAEPRWSENEASLHLRRERQDCRPGRLWPGLGGALPRNAPATPPGRAAATRR